MAELVPLSTIAPERVEALLDAAFGADRHKRTAYRLREGARAIDALSFAVTQGSVLEGSIQCWPVRIGEARLVLVGPVAVLPERQGMGIGHRLMHAMLDAAAATEEPPMVMIGDAEYYQRFGFSAEHTSGWTLPGPWDPRRLLARNVACHPLPAHGMLEPADAL